MTFQTMGASSSAKHTIQAEDHSSSNFAEKRASGPAMAV